MGRQRERIWSLGLSHEIRESRGCKSIALREVRENPHQEVEFVVCEPHNECLVTYAW